MKNWFLRCVPVVLASALVACGGSSNGGSSPPPANVTATAGDTWIQVNWDATPGLEYWAFTALDPSLTTLNWLNLTGAAAFIAVTPPLTLCAQMNGQQRWFTVNSRSGSDPGGPGSPVVSTTPRAAGVAWTPGATLGADLASIGFGVMTGCTRAGLATGVLTAVGPNAIIYASSDAGATWSLRAAPAGFSGDLFAVANYTASPNSTTALGMRTIAVGAGGVSLYSLDGSATWSIGRAADASRASLRALISVNSVFVAAGDAGTLQSTSDGITWNVLNSNTTTNLRGVAWGNSRYVVVGDGGTLVTSTDAGVTWTAQTLAGAGNLRAVVYGSNNNDIGNGGTLLINTFVAVGDNGNAVVSSDGGATWSVVAVPGAGDLTGIAYISRFVAVDSNGNAFSSADGKTWSAASTTGRSGLRSIVINGYGYIAVGDGGATATSF